MCIPGLYYLSHDDRFLFRPLFLAQSLPSSVLGVKGGDAAKRAARLVSTETVEWMKGCVERAFESPSVSPAALSRAISQFHRVRDCLESDAASEPLVASQIESWREENPDEW